MRPRLLKMSLPEGVPMAGFQYPDGTEVVVYDRRQLHARIAAGGDVAELYNAIVARMDSDGGVRQGRHLYSVA